MILVFDGFHLLLTPLLVTLSCRMKGLLPVEPPGRRPRSMRGTEHADGLRNLYQALGLGVSMNTTEKK